MTKNHCAQTPELHDAFSRDVPPLSTEPGMEFLSIPVRTFHGDPACPRQSIARFDFLIGWVDPWTLKPVDDEEHVLRWELLPKDAPRPADRQGVNTTVAAEWPLSVGRSRQR